MPEHVTEFHEVLRSGDYQPLKLIDFQILQHRFRKLPLFTDLYLSMQALNIALVDQLITDYEYQLLNEYFETEKTPVPLATMVSALSQMWIFSLYELLRTWSSRTRNILKHISKGTLDTYLSELSHVSYFSIPYKTVSKEAKKLADDEKYRKDVESAMGKFEELLRILTAFRLNLAKQEVPGKPKVLLSAPGYGRINMMCGSLDYQVYFDKDRLTIVNRRDIADMLRQILETVGQ